MENLTNIIINLFYYSAISAIVLFILGGIILYLGIRNKKRQLSEEPDLDLDGITFRQELKKQQKDLLNEINGKDNLNDLIRTKLGYHPENCNAVRNMECVKRKTQCLFAKQSKLWGSKDWQYDKTLEENVLESCSALKMFVDLGKPMHYDGFVIEIRGKQYGDTVEHFGDTVRRVLTTLSDDDPAHSNCMRKSYVGKKGWIFEFANEHMFVTSFASCYPSNHSRYMFNGDPESCFVLLQPMYSFAWHNVECDDSIPTNWENPTCIRDKIRVDFKNAGRNYEYDGRIRPSENQPFTNFTAYHIVKPLEVGGPATQWWIHPNQQ